VVLGAVVHICRAEVPDVAEVAHEFEGRVAFVGIAGRGEVPEMRRFVDDTNIGFFLQVVDTDGALWVSFGVTSQPAFAFIRADGNVEVVRGSVPRPELEAKAAELAA